MKALQLSTQKMHQFLGLWRSLNKYNKDLKLKEQDLVETEVHSFFNKHNVFKYKM